MVLVEEPLAEGSLFLVGASGPLDEECLVLVPPQIVDGCLSIPVGAVRVSASPMKNGPPTWPWRQQYGSLPHKMPKLIYRLVWATDLSLAAIGTVAGSYSFGDTFFNLSKV